MTDEPSVEPRIEPRIASEGDAARVTELVVQAFYDDPTWGWAFPDPHTRIDDHRRFWRLFVDGALRYPNVWLAGGDTADVTTSVWIPPGGSEFSPVQDAQLEALLSDLSGVAARRVERAFELFEEAHPKEAPHYYLSLLATHPDHRGHGHGLNLLAANLRQLDAERASAYLEASNPANVPLYERYGFERAGSFDLPEGGPTVHTMWRAPQGR